MPAGSVSVLQHYRGDVLAAAAVAAVRRQLALLRVQQHHLLQPLLCAPSLKSPARPPLRI